VLSDAQTEHPKGPDRSAGRNRSMRFSAPGEQAGRWEISETDLTVERSPYPSQSKQRLAGRTAKIRLETADLEAIKPPIQPMKQPDLPLTAQITHPPVQHTSDTSAHLPALGVAAQDLETVPWVQQQQLTRVGREKSAGSGHFEAGQCDVVVADTHIETTSVVLVTLIGNPGPVVVQYVSLLPQEGFTVHLTAPAAAKTPFNYVVL